MSDSKSNNQFSEQEVEQQLQLIEESPPEKNAPVVITTEMADAIFRTMDKLERKITASPALNGGFDTMMVKLDHITEKQATTSTKVDKIHDALYEPDSGFFARVKSIETNTTHIKSELTKHEKKDEEIDDAVQTHKQTTEKLTKIAGEDLQELSAIIKLKKNINNLFWLILAGGLGEFAKLAWEYYSTHHH